jgi:DNA-binding CsgD family transcriptional regulator
MGYAVFLLPRLAVGLRAEAELAAQARADRDEEGESTAVARAAKLLEQVRRLVAEEHRSSSHVDTMVNARLCELEAARTRGEATADDWARLAARCDEVGRPYLSAYARLREAEAAVAAGLPRSQIGETLAPAREIAAQLGAQPLLAEIEELAQRARLDLGDAAGPDAAAEAAGLTARELDVLRLVAEGKTNPEIGRALYMSPKTASVHVSRILAKLGVRSRVEAAGVAHRLRLIEPAN